MKKLRSVALRYGLPLLAYVLIVAVALSLLSFYGLRLDLTFLVIGLLIATAWYGGSGPGLMVFVLFELTIDYFTFFTNVSQTPPPTAGRFALGVFNRLLLLVSLVLFASSRRDAEKRLRQQREWLQVTLSSIGDAVIATNLDGLINFINPTAEALTGWTMADSVNQPFDKVFRIINEETREPVENPFAAVKRVGNIVGLANHNVLMARNGREIPIEERGAPIKDADGNIMGVIVVFHDVSDRRRAEQERAQLLRGEQSARNEAEAANRLKDEFLATVSHELRTPLNAILGWANILQRDLKEGETVRNGLGIIERNAKSQAEIIDDILDVSRIITGKLRIEAQPVEMAPIIQSAIDAVRPAAVAKEITIEVLLPPDAGKVMGDADRLQQIIWNLLSNAIKFTAKDGHITVRLEQVESHIRITVIDNGIGIDAQFLPYIFERFRQADASMTRSHGGLGLGLAIVRHLVELHGGTVLAESKGLGEGTRFIVQLPIAAVSSLPDKAAGLSGQELHAQEAMTDESAAAPNLTGLRILVVDDEPDTRDILSMVLNHYGAKVRASASARDAMEALLEWRPNVLISDLGMPEEDGLSLIRRVRALTPEQGGTVPAAALTAYARDEDRQQALSAGYHLYLSKPVDPEILATAVASLAKQN